jgi:hypothetical protein
VIEETVQDIARIAVQVIVEQMENAGWLSPDEVQRLRDELVSEHGKSLQQIMQIESLVQLNQRLQLELTAQKMSHKLVGMERDAAWKNVEMLRDSVTDVAVRHEQELLAARQEGVKEQLAKTRELDDLRMKEIGELARELEYLRSSKEME